MKLMLLLSLAGIGGALVSCAPVSVADVGTFSRNAMSFDQQGADLGEFGLVSQFEKGRASSSQSAGGG